MNELLDNNGQIDNKAVQNLFNRYISDGNPEAQKIFQQNMQKAAEELTASAELSDTETGRFSAGLQKYGLTLSQELDAPMLQSLVSEISQDTLTMRHSVETLQK